MLGRILYDVVVDYDEIIRRNGSVSLAGNAAAMA